jgi:hypothetical protein
MRSPERGRFSGSLHSKIVSTHSEWFEIYHPMTGAMEQARADLCMHFFMKSWH